MTKPLQCQGKVKSTTGHLVRPIIMGSAVVGGGALLYLIWPMLAWTSKRRKVRYN